MKSWMIFLIVFSIITIIVILYAITAAFAYPLLKNEDRHRFELENNEFQQKKTKSATRIIFAGLARDASRGLLSWQSHISTLSQHFQSVDVVVLEGGSVDNSRSILSEWKKNSTTSNIYLIDEEKNFVNSSREGTGLARMTRMTAFRNVLLTACERMESDVTVMVDFDLVTNFSYSEFTNTVEELHDNKRFESTSPIGLMRFDLCPWMHLIYDVYAFEDATTRDLKMTGVENRKCFYIQKKIARKEFANFTPVISNFGGFAFYKSDNLRAKRYVSLDGVCEHVTLHKQLKHSICSMKTFHDI